MVEAGCIYKKKVDGQDMYVLSVKEPSQIDNVALPSPHFGVLFLWDSQDTCSKNITNTVEKLIAAGGVYFSCWGQGCERLHDIIDEVGLGARGLDDDSILMTTWHEKDSLHEVLWYFLNVAFPDQAYEQSAHAKVVIIVRQSTCAVSCLEIVRQLLNEDSSDR